MALLGIIITADAIANANKKLPSWRAKLDRLLCRLKGSCSPKILQAVAVVGNAGYRKGSPTAWNYYLPNGIHLSWDLSKWYNAQAWYASGYWDKLKNAGLDECCLKSHWPPAEAFPLVSSVVPQHQIIKLPDGKTIEVDPSVFDPNSFQREWDEAVKTGEKPAGEIKSEKTPPTQSGLRALALPLLLFFAFRGQT